MLYDKLAELIGNTPLLQLKKIAPDIHANVFGKMEMFNPGGSIKDRIGKAMIEAGEKDGRINKDTLIVEPTSGNTGIALAMIAATKGYRLTLVMPDTMSIERRQLLKGLGADIELSPGKKGMKGAIEKAKSIAAQNENSFIPFQFSNTANPEIHRATTAEEIWNDTNGEIDFFVAGVGTGGTITGVSEALKKKNPDLKTVAVEPFDSPVLSGGAPGPHKIQGIGAGFIPEVLNTEIIDEIETVKNEEAYETARLLGTKEGVLAGISSGAAVAVALRLASREQNSGKNIVVILPDTGERYLSTELYK